jgi:CheY-like chemotaxis protein
VIIGVTGQVLDEDVKTFMKAGVNLVLGKPIMIDDIKNALAHFFS